MNESGERFSDANEVGMHGRARPIEALKERLGALMQLGLSLWVDGDKLRVSGNKILLDDNTLSELKTCKPQLLAWLRQEGFDRRYYPLSFGQQRLWFLDHIDLQNRVALNVNFAFGLRGVLDFDMAREAFAAVVRRQGSLRTAYVMRNHQPMQTLMEQVTLELPVLRRANVSGNGVEPDFATLRADVNEFAKADAEKPFDLEVPPLIRAHVLNYGAHTNAVVVTLHHIACDGWSLGLMFRDFVASYLRLTDTPVMELPDLAQSYPDFACCQAQRFTRQEQRRQLDFWRVELAGVDQFLDVPTDLPRPAHQSRCGARELMTLDATLLTRLKQLSRDHNVTLFTVLLVGYSILLHQESGQHDFIVGTDVANRTDEAIAELMGFFVNVVPVRTTFTGDPRFSDVLADVKQRLLRQLPYQEFPLDKLVDGLNVKRNPAHSPLVQVLFVLQNTFKNNLDVGGIEPFDIPIEAATTRFDLALFASESEQGLLCEWNYCTELFSPRRLKVMSAKLEHILKYAVDQPNARLSSFSQRVDSQAAEAASPGSGKAKAGRRSIKNKLRRLKKDKSAQSAHHLILVKKRLFDQPGDLHRAPGFPMVYEPANPDVDICSWAQSKRHEIEADLRQYGALLFRGFGVDRVEHFEQLARAIHPNLFGEYGDLPKADQGEKVYRSTPYPSDRAILYHNESSHMQRWPRMQWFYCLQPSTEGGATPIVDTRKIYQLLPDELRDKFETHGLMYTRNFTRQLDVSWQDYFKVDEKDDVEQICRERGIEWAWLAEGGLRTRDRAPAVRLHPETGEKSFFNQIQLHHISCLEDSVRQSLVSMLGEEAMPRNVYFGDGSPIPDAWVTSIIALYEQHAVRFQWQRGDVVMVDNMSMAHARDPFVGEREIRVVMGNMMSDEQYDEVVKQFGAAVGCSTAGTEVV